MPTFGTLPTTVLWLSLTKFFKSPILTFLRLSQMTFSYFLKISRINENIDGILESHSDYFFFNQNLFKFFGLRVSYKFYLLWTVLPSEVLAFHLTIFYILHVEAAY